ncbi:MAG: YhcH/YjgK/YiaL family protein [Sutterellaceae bacterium]|nr:YhcH/YjgK/YiaL family protein [Sutterellaceae bacterium]MDD7441194.1 YhcH/YjgK/YiaL family protein [Sutterellaceae bacterium]MDY2868830.1 YhcH/YjgK/YiaL family protein [Mesosutterella sp.]
MFTGSLKDWEQDKNYLPKAFDRAVEFLQKNAKTLEPGRHEIDGDRIFISVEEGMTKPASERRFESHVKYCDLQVVLEGVERQDYRCSPSTASPVESREAGDIWFYPDPENPQTLLMQPGDFVVYYPGELHAPNLAVAVPSRRRKVIVKVRADLLAE